MFCDYYFLFSFVFHVHLHVWVCVCEYMFVCVCIYMCVCIFVNAQGEFIWVWSIRARDWTGAILHHAPPEENYETGRWVNIYIYKYINIHTHSNILPYTPSHQSSNERESEKGEKGVKMCCLCKCMYVRMYVYTYVYLYVYVYLYLYVYIYRCWRRCDSFIPSTSFIATSRSYPTSLHCTSLFYTSLATYANINCMNTSTYQ